MFIRVSIIALIVAAATAVAGSVDVYWYDTRNACQGIETTFNVNVDCNSCVEPKPAGGTSVAPLCTVR